MAEPARRPGTVALRVAVFVVLAVALQMFIAQALLWIGGSPWYLVASVVSVFAAAAAANALAMRIYERARLADVGFAWNAAARRHLALGLGGGAGAAGVVLGGPLAAGGAQFVAAPAGDASLLFVLILLLFGAVGEEMLFRGYGFQLLLAALGPWTTILPTSVVFAWAHSSNLNVSWLALANTAAWGVLLGYAFWRSGDLWLPIGLHVGWNWVLPLAGARLSGFTMNLTGYELRYKLPALWSGGDYGPEGGLVTSLVLVAVLAGLWKAPVRRQQALLLKARWEA